MMQRKFVPALSLISTRFVLKQAVHATQVPTGPAGDLGGAVRVRNVAFKAPTLFVDSDETHLFVLFCPQPNHIKAPL